MNFFQELMTTESVARSILVISGVITTGLAFGRINFFGIRLGIAGVLFSGILFSHYGLNINPEEMHFIRDFGLILFVYTIGMQVGPGFFSSFKKNGLLFNLMAVSTVLGGTLVALGCYYFGKIPFPVTVGLLTGATTNTPSLGAAQQALELIPNVPADQLELPSLGYAVAYPFGVIGLILVLLIIRFIFRIDPQKEAVQYTETHTSSHHALFSLDLVVENQNVDGIELDKIPSLAEKGVVISRVMHHGKVATAKAGTRIHMGDIVRVVGPKSNLDDARLIIGRVSPTDITGMDRSIEARRVMVTKQSLVGKTLADLNIRDRYDVSVTRVARGDIEIPADPDVALQLADVLMTVGEKEDLDEFAREMGNAPKDLDHPLIVPIFIGIALGVIVGSIPIPIPGVPYPVKLGLAGGPLIVSIILSRIGRIGNVIWYMSGGANNIMKEFGIVLFLTSVGLRSGEHFVEMLVNGSGFYWMALGAVITFVPALVLMLIGRLVFKLNYLTLGGLMAGSHTDPPALAFANSLTHSSAPSVAYATVYPMVMFMRIISAQVLILLFMH